MEPASSPTFDNTYAELPERFYSRLEPEPVSDPETIRVNRPLADRLGFDADWLASEDGAKVAVGNEILDGAEPIAMAYAGHQFGNWVPQLGDGRAILLGEVLDASGERFDIQLKGSGRTPYSRRGDGRAPLGPVLREYIVSEAMFALGIPTTRSLVAAKTGERVIRRTTLPGGVLVRVAQSHIRVGTFEYFAGRGDAAGVRTLLEYVVERHYGDLDPDEPAALLQVVVERQARLVAQWQLVGFIHGVMNTDNMLLSGETIDYGPCAFMNEYDPDTVYSSIDRGGRYAYGNQRPIAAWNLTRLGEALLQGYDEPDAHLGAVREALASFDEIFEAAWREGMASKLGLVEPRGDDISLFEGLLTLMAETDSDFTLTFRRLTELAAMNVDSSNTASEPVGEVWTLPEAFEPWLARWRARLESEDRPREAQVADMRRRNPVVIPRNHHVEAAIADAVERDDFSAFHTLVEALATPFEYPESMPALLRPPTPEERVSMTFCGT